MTDRQFEDRILLYVDLLGTSEAVMNRDGLALIQLVDLLEGIASQRGEYKHEGTAFRFKITPTITTFSDHIVASFPLENELTPEWSTDHQAVGKGRAYDAMVTILRVHATRWACNALKIGLLLRGGMTVGKAYHTSDVVAGPALVEAYMLEHKTAVYPRIVMAESICGLLAAKLNRHSLCDADGIMHLNYFEQMVSVGNHTYGEDWEANARCRISENIDALRSRGARNQFAKWVWFKNRFDAMAAPPLTPKL